MRPSTHIIIKENVYSDGEYKKYRSTEEQIRQNQHDNAVQRERDERARNDSLNIRQDRTGSDTLASETGGKL